MRKIDMELCEKDTEFVKITYYSSFTSGSMVMKKHFFELKAKSISALLRGCEWTIIKDYHPLLIELLDIDPEIQRLRGEIKRKTYYMKHYESILDTDEVKDILNFISQCENEIAERTDKIVKERR